MGLVLKLRYTDILRQGSLKNFYVSGKPAGFQFDVRLAYYRGHFLSDIERLGVMVDGAEQEKEKILFCLNEKEFSPDELKYQIAEFWNIKQPATVKVHCSGGLSAGEHEIYLDLILRCPYLPLPGSMEPHSYTPIDSCDKKIMRMEGIR